MQNNTPKTPFFISIVILFISIILFSYFYKIASDSDQSFRLKEEEWQKESLRRDQIRELNNSIKTIEEQSAQLGSHFAKSSDIVPFLNTIEGLASKVGAKAEVTSVDIETDDTILLVGMKASGAFGNIYKFLTLLENSPYELKFLSMDINKEIATDAVGKSMSRGWNAVFRIKLLSFVK